MKLSIIIPVLNEAAIIGALLQDLRSRSQAEIIVVDGGSTDETVAIAKDSGVKVLVTTGGRGRQMNLGAAIAEGNVLLFLHADTQLPPDFETQIGQILISSVHTKSHSPTAGAFHLKIDAPLWSLRVIEWGVEMRSRICQLPYGDQALFLSKDVFERMGGFSDLPIMEDFEFVCRLRKSGYIVLAPTAVKTSARRWLRRGAVQTTLMNQGMILGFWLGISPEKLRQWYRRLK